MKSSTVLGISVNIEGKNKPWFGLQRRLLCGLIVALTVISGTTQATSPPDIFTTTSEYVTTFYPLWFTYYQSQVATSNRFVGPERISPLYQIVVAINDDTLYGSTFLDLTTEPVIVTIPSATVFCNTTVTYSILLLDPYGTVYNNIIPADTAGTFGLTGPDFTGTLPPEVIPVPLPFNHMQLIFRTDKFAPAPALTNQIPAAEVFRASVRALTLSDYNTDPCTNTTLIVPEIATAVPFKTAADELLTKDPITFLQQLQVAVAAPNTPPLSRHEQTLSDHFNALFGNGNWKRGSGFGLGARVAHDEIVNSYLSHHPPITNWIHFTNIGNWGNNVLDRASITEFIQYGNDISTAAYYQTFLDQDGDPLSSTNPHGYVLKFPGQLIPQAGRFWSITAYTPESIELIDNAVHKYEVAQYTDGLVYGQDQSLTIYMTPGDQPPPGVPTANWLPIEGFNGGAFNIMLRIYGVIPGSPIANNTYIPPAIRKAP
jgi:hypothetical protein